MLLSSFQYISFVLACFILRSEGIFLKSRWLHSDRLSNRNLYNIRGGNTPTDKSSSKIKGTVIGIDLGTTYSCVAVWKNGRVEVCPNEQGNRITPSYVAWDESGQRLVGDAAKNQAASNPINTVFDVKRLIGRKFNDESVQKDSKLFPYKCNVLHRMLTNILISIYFSG
jgi:hypothetical protein